MSAKLRRIGEQNQVYAVFVTAAMRAGVRYAHLQATGVAFKEALRCTFQDSGRAAFNWHILIGPGEMQAPMLSYGVGPVGFRDEKRSDTGAWTQVFNHKLQEYQIDEHRQIQPGTLLYESFGIPVGKWGWAAPKRISIYNSLFLLPQTPRTMAYLEHAFSLSHGQDGTRCAPAALQGEITTTVEWAGKAWENYYNSQRKILERQFKARRARL